jgi:hypothetical protein
MNKHNLNNEIDSKEINEKIISIWNKYPSKSKENSPLLYPKFKRDAILFIGLNPSLSKKAFNIIWKGKGFEYSAFFKKENLEKYGEKYIEGEQLSKEKYSYFKKFREILEYLREDKLNFNHIDLFLYRKTDQNDFKKNVLGLSKIKEDDNKDTIIETKNFTDFEKEQLKLSSDIIKLIKPKLIVVANAFASDIIKHYKNIFKINETNFDKNGYDTINLGKKDIPIIFTSMLTQQRALDNHSFRRLKWEIKIILSKIQ